MHQSFTDALVFNYLIQTNFLSFCMSFTFLLYYYLEDAKFAPGEKRINREKCSQCQTSISCRWQTRALRCITEKVLQTNKVDAQSDKLATELSWQSFASKVTNFQLLHLHLTYPTCILRLRWGDPV